MTPPDSPTVLESDGFRGFITIGQLHREGCIGVPDERGVYAVLVRGDAPHEFRPRSSAPAWRGKDPTVPLDELQARWVAGATLLYAGRARGPGVRSRLRQRIKRYLRFGHGRVVAHWGGRLIWQLREPSRLVVAWRTCGEAEDPARLEAELLARFEQHYGALPFANLSAEPAADDDDDSSE
jgi:hypothetical protein